MYTPTQLARYLRVRPTLVKRWIRSGELAAVDLSTHADRSRRLRISQDALDEFLERRRIEPRKKRRRLAKVKQFFSE